MTTEPTPDTTAIAPKNTQEGKRMWPSATVASRVYDIANIFLVVSLVLGVVATALVVWMGAVKEAYSREEVAALGLKTAEANERAAKANEAAERERVERLKLEARLADRVLAPEAAGDLRALALRFPRGTKLDINIFGSSLEITNISGAIADALTAGGWVVRRWSASGGSVRGMVIGSDPAKTTTARAAGELAAILTAHGISASEYPYSGMPVPSMLLGPGEPMDAPIRLYIGSKQ